MTGGREIVSLIGQRQDLDQFRKKNWEGTFDQYLDIVSQDGRATRNAFQRVYDMILSYGTETYEVTREKRVHYKFFGDPDYGGRVGPAEPADEGGVLQRGDAARHGHGGAVQLHVGLGRRRDIFTDGDRVRRCRAEDAVGSR